MNNLNVFASAVIAGGTYDNIRIYGSAEITGDLVAESMNVYGSTNFSGKCEIKDVDVYGSCRFNDLVKVNSLNIKGSCDFNNDVKVDALKVYGSVKFNKKVFRSEEIVIYGAVKSNTLESDKILVKGVLECTEQLNADLIEITSNSGSKIKEMVGSNIVVKPHKKLFSKPAKPVEAELIEGDLVELENVIAKVVRGNKVKIGPNCKIDKLEYNESYEVSDKSKVLETEKI